MKTVRIRYHYEPDGWWADSEDLSGWTAVGESFDEVRSQAKEGARAHADGPVSIVEEGVPVPGSQAGVWKPASGTAMIGTSFVVTSFSVVPSSGQAAAGVRHGALEPDDELSKYMSRAS